jgi:hypothetical protein
MPRRIALLRKPYLCTESPKQRLTSYSIGTEAAILSRLDSQF